MLKYLTLQLSLVETQTGSYNMVEKVDKLTQIARIVQEMGIQDNQSDYARLKKDVKSTMTRMLASLEKINGDVETLDAN